MNWSVPLTLSSLRALAVVARPLDLGGYSCGDGVGPPLIALHIVKVDIIRVGVGTVQLRVTEQSLGLALNNWEKSKVLSVTTLGTGRGSVTTTRLLN